MNGVTAKVAVYNLDGSLKYTHTDTLTAAPSAATDGGAIAFPDGLSAVHFVKLELRDAQHNLLSDNFYWRETQQDNFQALNTLPMVPLTAQVTRQDARRQCPADRHPPEPLPDARADGPPATPAGPHGPARPAGLLQRQLRLAAAGRVEDDHGGGGEAKPGRRRAAAGRGRLERDGEARRGHRPEHHRPWSAILPSLAAVATSSGPLKINCGGGGRAVGGFFTFGAADAPGDDFVADTDFTGGDAKSVGDAIDTSAAERRPRRPSTSPSAGATAPTPSPSRPGGRTRCACTSPRRRIRRRRASASSTWTSTARGC